MAITPGNSTTNNGGSGTSTSFSHTCAAGSNMLVVTLGYNGTNDRGATCTYDGVAMTKCNSNRNYDGGGLAIIFYLINPPTEVSKTVALTFSFNVDNRECAFDFAGADTADPLGGAASSGQTWSATTSESRTVTTTGTDSIIVDVMRYSGDVSPVTVGANQTEIEDQSNGSSSYELTTTTGGYAMSWTYSSAIISHTCREFKSASAAGPATLKTFDTIASASIKTTNGVAQASVKTMDTVT